MLPSALLLKLKRSRSCCPPASNAPSHTPSSSCTAPALAGPLAAAALGSDFHSSVNGNWLPPCEKFPERVLPSLERLPSKRGSPGAEKLRPTAAPSTLT